MSLRVLTLRCPSCAAQLEVAPDMEHFACGYCGTQQIVERRGGTVALKLIGDAIARVQAGTDKTASELAIVRLEKELAQANGRLNATMASAALEAHSIQVNKLAPGILGSVFAGFILIVGIGSVIGSGVGLAIGGAVAIVGCLMTQQYVNKLKADIDKRTGSAVKTAQEQVSRIREQLDHHRTIVS